MLPIPGCDIAQASERLTFTIRHINRMYHVTVASDSDHAEWMAALILCANAKLPSERAPLSPSSDYTSRNRSLKGNNTPKLPLERR